MKDNFTSLLFFVQHENNKEVIVINFHVKVSFTFLKDTLIAILTLAFVLHKGNKEVITVWRSIIQGLTLRYGF